MRATLVRIGVDNAYGHWNAPADPDSGEFVYVPIPENMGTQFHSGSERPYSLALPALRRFASDRGLDVRRDLRMPAELEHRVMHLDPDFETLTYGDVGHRRGSNMRSMERGDLIVFYAGLRPTKKLAERLIYALVGLYVVDEVVAAVNVEPARRDENAHTRKLKPGETDIVVRAQAGCSGRFRRFIDIGEFRDRAYRVRPDILDAWGDLSVKNGYLQRSAVPPRFLDPERFMRWFEAQDAELLQLNW